MKKHVLILGLWVGMAGGLLAQNVGIGEPAPQERLDIAGNVRGQGSLSLDPETATAAEALTVDAGRSVFAITATAGVQTNAVTMAGTPRAGQVLYILNLDDDPGTFEGLPIAPGSVVSAFLNRDGSSTGWMPFDSGVGDWKLLGNLGTDPTVNYLGTQDARDLVFRTDATEKVRVQTDGDVGIGTANPDFRLEVQGGNIEVENEDADCYIRFHDPNDAWYSVGLDQSDAHKFKINLGSSPGENTHLTMTTGGDVGIGTNVPNGAMELYRTTAQANVGPTGFAYGSERADLILTRLHGPQQMGVGYPASLIDFRAVNSGGAEWSMAQILSAADVGATNHAGGLHFLTSSGGVDDPVDRRNRGSAPQIRLTVEGGGDVGIGVTDPGFRLDVRNGTTAHVMNVVNTTNGGDGIRIQLNGNHPRWNGSAYAAMPIITFSPFTNAITAIQNYINNGGSFNPMNMIPSLGLATQAGNAMCSLSNQVVNLMLGSSVFQSINLSYPCGVNWDTDVGFDGDIDFSISIGFDWCSFDPFPNSVNFGCPTANFGNFSFSRPTWTVTNSLTTGNEFLTFVDQGGRWCGAVSGESVANWTSRQVSTCNVLEIIESFSSLDPLDLMASANRTLVCYAEEYNSIGVVYRSGNADYAEWLRRRDPKERLSPGDVVAVRTGLITKDLTGAEQLMVISSNPIMVGNAPDEADKHLGNNVAFMGQVPVKVRGPVTTGDFIVADGGLAGYARAVPPSALTESELALCVGRAWETKDAPGPKMVNTVIGVDDGGWKNVLLKLRQDLLLLQATKEEQYDRRFRELEQRFEVLMQACQTQSSLPPSASTATQAAANGR